MTIYILIGLCDIKNVECRENLKVFKTLKEAQSYIPNISWGKYKTSDNRVFYVSNERNIEYSLTDYDMLEIEVFEL